MAAGQDPFAVAPQDPLAVAPQDPFAVAPQDPFAVAPQDPFAVAPQDPFATPSVDPFAVAVVEDPFEEEASCEFNEMRERLHSFCDGTRETRSRASEYILSMDNKKFKWWMNRYDQLESRVMERSAFLVREARNALREAQQKVRTTLLAPFDFDFSDLKIDVAKLRVEAKKHATTSVDIWDWKDYSKKKRKRTTRR